MCRILSDVKEGINKIGHQAEKISDSAFSRLLTLLTKESPPLVKLAVECSSKQATILDTHSGL